VHRALIVVFPVFGLALSVSGCAAAQTATAPISLSTMGLSTWSPSTLQVVDRLRKDSIEPGKVVIAVLVRGHIGAFAQVSFEPRRKFVRPSSCPDEFPPYSKALDSLHPDAVQPAAPSITVGDAFSLSDDVVEGWMSWQVPIPGQGCGYTWSTSAHLTGSLNRAEDHISSDTVDFVIEPAQSARST
jgi:hypothetical protein